MEDFYYQVMYGITKNIGAIEITIYTIICLLAWARSLFILYVNYQTHGNKSESIHEQYISYRITKVIYYLILTIPVLYIIYYLIGDLKFSPHFYTFVRVIFVSLLTYPIYYLAVNVIRETALYVFLNKKFSWWFFKDLMYYRTED